MIEYDDERFRLATDDVIGEAAKATNMTGHTCAY